MNKFKEYEKYGNRIYLLYLAYIVLIAPLGTIYIITSLFRGFAISSFSELGHRTS